MNLVAANQQSIISNIIFF